MIIIFIIVIMITIIKRIVYYANTNFPVEDQSTFNQEVTGSNGVGI